MLNVQGESKEKKIIKAMLDLASQLASNSSYTSQMNYLCETVATLLGCDRSSIFLLEDGYYKAKFNYGNPPDIAEMFPRHRVSLKDPLIAKVMEIRSFIIVNDAINSDLMNRRTALAARIQSIVVAPVFDENQAPRGLLTAEYNENPGSFTDVDAAVILGIAQLAAIRSKVEAADLERIRSERKYRKLHETMRDGFVYVDMQGFIQDSNETYRAMLGYSAEELVRLTYIDLTPGKWHGFEREIMERQVLVRGFSDVYEKEYRKKDGRIFPVELRTVLIRNDAGENQGLWAIVRDISERKRAEAEREKIEAQLRQLQKMESIGNLVGGVAHDYNNMLSVILGFTELALDKLNPSEPLHADLTEIFTAAKRSAVITRQLLAFARKQTIAPKVLDMNETVENMLKMLRRLIGEDIDLAWMPEGSVWPIKIDPSQLEQILANLCVNARDAIAGVGKVTIETHTITFDEAYCAMHAGFVPGEFALLAVSDDGCGMDKETLEHIFEPYFTTKDVNHGTGLGLATVYGIVKQNSGFINVYSEPGKGTTFRIYLPRHLGDAEKTSVQVITENQAGRGERVLLVEDETAIREMSQKMLERLGYRVLTAATPGEAVRLADKHPDGIELLITDVVMPEMNGRDLANRLHSLYPDIKILFMSGYTSDVIAHRGVLDEGVQFIQKPFSMKDLGVKVRAILDQK